MSDLQRFIKAQEGSYECALSEIKNGKKISHWMWYIFPQLKGLGRSSTAEFYSITGLKETEEYLSHPVLGKRLIAISNELLNLPGNNAIAIFGTPDDMKLRSSMTLFSLVQNADPVFELVLKKFFSGAKDERTLELIGNK